MWLWSCNRRLPRAPYAQTHVKQTQPNTWQWRKRTRVHTFYYNNMNSLFRRWTPLPQCCERAQIPRPVGPVVRAFIDSICMMFSLVVCVCAMHVACGCIMSFVIYTPAVFVSNKYIIRTQPSLSRSCFLALRSSLRRILCANMLHMCYIMWHTERRQTLYGLGSRRPYMLIQFKYNSERVAVGCVSDDVILLQLLLLLQLER